jgi:3D (Asp-Asp-Asp) domain-containing protein
MGYASGNGIGFYTSTGTRVHWGTVAVDPKLIPLGSLMLIQGLEGVFIAEDTGPGIRDAMVDVWFPDLAGALRFGTQNRTIIVIREGYGS